MIRHLKINHLSSLLREINVFETVSVVLLLECLLQFPLKCMDPSTDQTPLKYVIDHKPTHSHHLEKRNIQGGKCPIYSYIWKIVLYIPIYPYIWKTVLYIPIFQGIKKKQEMLNSYLKQMFLF